MSDGEYGRVPPNIMEGLVAYRDTGRRTGSFLEAVLRNNLAEAVGRADRFSLAALKDIVQWVWWEMPAHAWGSEQKVRAWMQAGGVQGLAEKRAAEAAGEEA